MLRAFLAVGLAAALCAGAVAEEAEVEPPETKRVVGLLDIPATWDGSLELGYSAARGNTDTDDLRFAARADEETESHRIFLDLTYDWGATDGSSSRNKVTAGALKDWLVRGYNHFFFAEGRYDWDRFQAWRHRFSGRVGVGYDFLRTDEWTVTGRVGLGATEGCGDGRSVDVEGSAGGDARWKPRDGLELGLKSTYYATLNKSRFGNPFRTVSSAYCQFRMAAFEQVSVRFSLEHEHQSEVPSGYRRDDFRWATTVVYSF